MRHRLAVALMLTVLTMAGAATAQTPASTWTPPNLPGITVPTIDRAALAAARQQKRMALVVGNSLYPTAPLHKPGQDARSMAAVLQWLGYDVTLRENLGGEAMRREIDVFAGKLKATGASGLFYFSGHGVQGEAGYLLPVDLAVNADEITMQYRALPVPYVLSRMENARDGVDVVIIDACRNNPYVRGIKSGGEAAVRPIPAGKRSLVAFATRLGATANEGPENEAHSVFTQRLLTAMLVPGARMRDVLDEVQESVRSQTQDRQIPDYSSSLGRLPVHFIPSQQNGPPPQAGQAPQAGGEELQIWTIVEAGYQPMLNGSTSAEEDYFQALSAYARKYPSGVYGNLAKLRMASLSGTIDTTGIQKMPRIDRTPQDLSIEQLMMEAERFFLRNAFESSFIYFEEAARRLGSKVSGNSMDLRSAQAFRITGWMLANGVGVARNETLARRWFEFGTSVKVVGPRMNEPDPVATFNLALFHENGLGGYRRDLQKALSLYYQASASGLPEAMESYNRLSKLLKKTAIQ